MSLPAAIRLALVDDDPLVRDWLRTRFEQAPQLQVVGEAGSAGEALVLAAHTQLDVMLVDIAMRDMTGVFLTADLRKRHPAIRVLIFSMHDKATYVNSATNAGARGYVLKNPNAQEIIEAVLTIAQGGDYYGAGVPRPDARAASSARLTPRETEVMRLVAKGLKNELIAQRLGIRSSTVMRHRLNFRDKLGLDTVIEIRKYAEDHGLLSDP